MSRISKDFIELANKLEEYCQLLQNFTSLLEGKQQDYDEEEVYEASEIRENLHDLSFEIINTFKSGKFPPSDKVKIQKLKRDFQKLLQQYEDQSEILAQIKENEKEKIAETYRSYQRDGLMGRTQSIDESIDKQQSQILDEDEDQNIKPIAQIYDQMLHNKQTEIDQIKSNAQEIFTMQKELAETVKEQGESVNQIELQVVQSEENTKTAVSTLTKAKNIKKSNTKCYFWIVAIILLIIIGVVVSVLMK